MQSEENSLKETSANSLDFESQMGKKKKHTRFIANQNKTPPFLSSNHFQVTRPNFCFSEKNC